MQLEQAYLIQTSLLEKELDDEAKGAEGRHALHGTLQNQRTQ